MRSYSETSPQDAPIYVYIYTCFMKYGDIFKIMAEEMPNHVAMESIVLISNTVVSILMIVIEHVKCDPIARHGLKMYLCMCICTYVYMQIGSMSICIHMCIRIFINIHVYMYMYL
jgi:hypothetical protein